MSGLQDWISPRRRVLMWIAAGYTSFFIVFALAWVAAPRIAPIDDAVQRLLLGVQLCALPAAVLMMMLQGLWRVFDTPTAEDTLNGQTSQRFQINQRVFTNTVEQTLIFAPMFLALCIRIDPAHVFVLPLLMGVWCVGRLVFWAGYQLEPVYRAIGMDWTTGVSSVTAFWLLWTLF